MTLAHLIGAVCSSILEPDLMAGEYTTFSQLSFDIDELSFW